MKLSVVIVSYNVKYYLAQCLRSVEKAIGVLECGQQGDASGDTAEIIVVDNHSQDGTVEYLEQCFPASRYPNLHVVACTHNNGFARANNLAIRKSESDLVLLLNPDTIIGEHVLKDAVCFMRSHPDAGALGVRMLGANGKPAPESRRGLPSPMVAFYKMMGLCSRFPQHRSFGHYYMGYLPWDKPAKIEVVSGAFCMIRREALLKVGLLDEDFFMYGEDIDLSYRILKGGYQNYYLPVDILHYKGESTQKSSFRYVHVFYEAMLIFFRKHYSGMSWLISLPIKAAIYAKATLALFQMQIDRARKSLGFITYEWQTPNYVFVGSKEMQEQCGELVRRKGLMAEFVACGKNELTATFLEKITDSKKLQIVVFDVSEFDYEQILEVFAVAPSPLRKIGFYHQNSGMLITDAEVIK